MTIMNSLYPNISEPFLLGSLPSQTTFLKRTYLKFQFIRRHTDTSRHVKDNASNVPDKSGATWSTGFWEEDWMENRWGRNYWQIQNDDDNKLSHNSRWPITNARGSHLKRCHTKFRDYFSQGITSKRCNTKFRDYFSQSVISNTNTVAFFVFHKTYTTIMNESVESLITNCFDIWHIFPLM